MDHPVQPCLGVRTDDDSLDAELGLELLLPLVAEVRQADHGEALHAGTFHHLADDEQGLYGLADTDVVSNQQADGVLSQGHHQGHDLVGTGAERELGQGPERPGAVAECQTGGVIEETGRGDVAKIFRAWRREAGVLRDVVRDLKREVDAGGFLVGAAQRFDDEQVGVTGREHDPVAAAQGHQLARLQRRTHRIFLKMSERRAIVAARSSR